MRAFPLPPALFLVPMLAGVAALPALSEAPVPGSHPAVLEAAAGKVEITPAGPCYIAGYDRNRVSTGVHDPLWARCLVLRSGGETVALVSCDLIGVLRYHAQRIRALVRSVPPDHVLIGATHTHSGPDTYGQWGPNAHTSGVDEAWMHGLYNRVAELVDSAAAHLRPARVRFGSVSGIQGCSRNARVPEILDTELSAMQVLDAGGATICTLVNYACHPEILNNHQITADFPYWLRQRVEQKLGGAAIYFNGAQGGMVTADIQNEQRYPRGEAWPEAQRIGETLGDKAVEALRDASDTPDPAITFHQRVFNVPLESPAFEALMAAHVLPSEIASGAGKTVTTEVSRLTVGPAEFITLPGEVLPNIGLYLKRHMTGTPRFELGLTGDALGYILTPEDFGLRLYRYESSVSVGPQMGRRMEQSLLALLGADRQAD